MAARRDVYIALAYLDVADRSAETRQTALLERIEHIAGSVESLLADIRAQQTLVGQIAGFLGVVLPPGRP